MGQELFSDFFCLSGALANIFYFIFLIRVLSIKPERKVTM